MKCVGTPISPSFSKTNSEIRLLIAPFTIDLGVLLVVERGCIVFEVLDERARLRTLIEDLGLTFVDAASPVHSVLILARRFPAN